MISRSLTFLAGLATDTKVTEKTCLSQTTLVTTTETEKMAQHKSIHYSSVDTPGKKDCEQFLGFTNQVWLCQGLANIPKVKCLNSDLLYLWSAETFPMAQVSLLHVLLPPSLPYCRPRKCSRPGVHCPSGTWAHLTGRRAGRRPSAKQWP